MRKKQNLILYHKKIMQEVYYNQLLKQANQRIEQNEKAIVALIAFLLSSSYPH
ncbi:unknown protein [Microcystis aeruginosa NIES-843]|uniref:Uncharacterized protein n=1 Tax=Microcystis aeruginosa (strain NIES-843 / IAM M-2473) TaxID=449447 RepID=B0JGI4_MICAN|nr:unknown protein [Microcystis aeruginosa NIES-843]